MHTTKIPAHAVTRGQKIVYMGQQHTVTNNVWHSGVDYKYTSCSITVAEEIHREFGGEPHSFGIKFNEPVEVVVGASTKAR